MLSLALGPVALPVSPLLLLCAIGVASWLGTRLGARRATDAGHEVLVAAAIGLATARLAHLVLNAQAYVATPASMIDLRDGGWHGAAGVISAGAWLVWRAWRVPRGRRPLALAALAGSLVWLTGAWAFGMHAGSTLPALSLLTLEGQPLELRAAARGRPVVVNLWASWCGPCREEMPALAAAQQREDKVGLLFVNQGESAAAIGSYLATLGAPLREVLRDPGSALGPAVGSRGLPTTLFYDAQGRLVDAHFGVLSPAALEVRLRALRPAR